MKIREIFYLDETATIGATSAGSIATVINPDVAIGPDRNKKSYSGSPGKSGTKPPNLPKITQRKNADGTVKNALDSNDNLFGAPIKR